MPTAQKLFQFQIVTDTPKEAEQFMKEVEACHTSIEEWWYTPSNGDKNIEECYGFGVTHYKPKLIKRLADSMDFYFVYAELYQCSPDCHCDELMSVENQDVESQIVSIL